MRHSLLCGALFLGLAALACRRPARPAAAKPAPVVRSPSSPAGPRTAHSATRCCPTPSTRRPATRPRSGSWPANPPPAVERSLHYRTEQSRRPRRHAPQPREEESAPQGSAEGGNPQPTSPTSPRRSASRTRPPTATPATGNCRRLRCRTSISRWKTSSTSAPLAALLHDALHAGDEREAVRRRRPHVAVRLRPGPRRRQGHRR